MNTRKPIARWTALSAAILLTASLSACASEPAAPPVADPSSSAPSETPATPSATPEASEEPSPSATPDGEEIGDIPSWVVSHEGIGPLEIGADFDAVLDSLPSEAWTNDEQCSWVAFANSPENDYTVHFLHGTEADRGPIVLAAISTSEATANGPRTAEGVGLGSSREEVRDAYPAATEAVPTSGVPEGRSYLVVSEGDTKTFFAFDGESDVIAVTVTTLPEPPYESCG